MRKRKSIILFIFIAFSIVFIYVLLFCSCNYKKHLTFPDNEDGLAIPLLYAKNFERIDLNIKIASITQYADGFLGAYYGKMYYFNENTNSMYEVNIPEGYYSLSDIRYLNKDKNKLWDPTGLFYDQDTGYLFIANYRSHNLLVCNCNINNDSLILDVQKEISYEGMQSPENVYVKNGVIAVADYDGNSLWVFDLFGNLLWSKEIKLAHGVAISDTSIYVTSLFDRTICRYSLAGEFIYQIGNEAYEGTESFMWPTSLDYSNGNIIVSDAHTGRIYIFDEDLKYNSSIGGIGPSDNTFNFPYCANYFNDAIYVADVFNNRVVVLNKRGQIKKILGKSIENIELDIMLQAYNNIPYTYGLTNEVESTFFNPYLSAQVINGYDSLIFYNENYYFQINCSDYTCNQTIFDTQIPMLEQLYIIWIKKMEVDNKQFVIVGSPENTSQYYIYNATDNIFFINAEMATEPIWYVKNKWYCQKNIDSILSEKIHKADASTKIYMDLISNGYDRKQAYIEAFMDYYNNQLIEPMSEETFRQWISSFFSSESGKKFWNEYSDNNMKISLLTDNYYKETQTAGTHLCECFFVKMFGQIN